MLLVGYADLSSAFPMVLLKQLGPSSMVLLKQLGVFKVSQTWYQVRFLRSILGYILWACAGRRGGGPGTVPLHNLRSTSHVLC